MWRSLAYLTPEIVCSSVCGRHLEVVFVTFGVVLIGVLGSHSPPVGLQVLNTGKIFVL